MDNLLFLLMFSMFFIDIYLLQRYMGECVKNIIIMTSDNSRDQLVNSTLDILRSVTCEVSLCKHAFENYNS